MKVFFFLLFLANPLLAQNTWHVTIDIDTDDGLCDSDCSLREAIDLAASGDFIFIDPFLVPRLNISMGEIVVAGKDLTILGGDSPANRATVVGDQQDAILNLNDAEIVFQHLIISEGGRACIQAVDSKIELKNSDISNCENPSDGGGGFHITGSELAPSELIVDSDSKIENNHSSSSVEDESFGGGIYADGHSTITLFGEITGNSAERGGGIYLEADAELYLESGVIHSNEALQLSSASNTAEGGGVYSNGGIVSGSGIINENSADYRGSGIHNQIGMVDLSNCTIHDNGGGQFSVALVSFNGMIILTDCDIKGNQGGAILQSPEGSTEIVGGMIYEHDRMAVQSKGDARLEIQNVTFENNEGAVDFSSGRDSLFVKNSYFGQNHRLASPEIAGGLTCKIGICVISDSDFVDNENVAVRVTTSGEATISGTTFTNNPDGAITASGIGGLYLSEVTFDNNANSSQEGLFSDIAALTIDGGVFENHSSERAIVIEGGVVTLSNFNIVDNLGGGLLVEGTSSSPATVTIDTINFSRNGISNGHEAALTLIGEVDVTVISSDFESNYQRSAGSAIVATNTNSLSIDQTTFRNHGRTPIAITGGTVDISDSSVSDNDAPSEAGGILITQSAAVNIYRSAILNNTTAGNGGGIQLDNSTLLIRNSTISNNESIDGSMNYGGGIYASNGSVLTIENSTIARNVADSEGGGLYLNSLSIPATVTSLYSSLVVENQSLNTALHDIKGFISTEGYNAISDGTGLVGPVDGSNNDFIGFLDSPINSLGDNGGLTQTHGVPENSLALDNGSCSVNSIAQDQRTWARPVDQANIVDADDGCDIGAIENGASLSTEIELDIIVFLQGAYHASGLMTNDLNPNFIPLNQPYRDAPYSYSGNEILSSIPVDMVDWVKVELRNSSSPTIVEDERAAILLRDGSVVDTDGTSSLSMPVAGAGDYYLVVCHRNHLCIMSATAQTLSDGRNSYNFSSDLDSAYGNESLVDNGDGSYSMWGGDGDQNGNVSAFDFLNVWLPENGSPPSYTLADFNLNSEITVFDFINIWLISNGRASQVP